MKDWTRKTNFYFLISNWSSMRLEHFQQQLEVGVTPEDLNSSAVLLYDWCSIGNISYFTV